MILILTGAVKEQQVVITSQQEKIDDLEKRLITLENKIVIRFFELSGATI